MNRSQIAALIAARLQAVQATCRAQYEASEKMVGHFVIDDLLPLELMQQIHAAFPDPAAMMVKSSLRERKYVAAQMNRYPPLLEEIIYAFQDPAVVDQVRQITGVREPEPDTHLYAGGISLMGEGCFLNPHLDNSHDKDRQRWRVLNLLYYVTPDWNPADGGNLELWPDGPKKPNVMIESLANRLVVMATHDDSWHSVSAVRTKRARCCVSNYYFSAESLRESDRFHVTSFRGRPEQPLRNSLLTTDAWLRMQIRKVFPKGVRENPHVYRQ